VEPGFGRDTIAGLAGRIAGMAPVAVRFGWNGARLNGRGHLGLDGENLRLSGDLGGPPIELHATRAQVTGWQRISAQRIGLRLRADGGNGQLPLRVLEFERGTDAERLVAWLPGSASRSSLVRRWYEERLGPYRREALASYAIAAVLLACYVLQAINGGALAFDAQRLFAQGANLPPQTLSGEPWRLLTAVFLHADFGHLLGNAVTLVALAPYVERLYGRHALLAVFLGAGLAGSAVDLFTNFSTVAVGASGAVFGILGALLAYPLRRPGQLPLASMRAILALGGLYLAWSLKQGFDSVGINNSAHVSGLVAGFVLGLLLAPPFERERRPPTLALAAAGALLLALAGCAVAVAVARGSDNFRLARLLSDLGDRAQALDASCQAATTRLLADPRDGRAAYHDACVAPLDAVDAELRGLAPGDATLDQQVAEQLARIARRRDANRTLLASLGDVADRQPAEAARADALAACDRALALLDAADAGEAAARLREACIGGFDRALDLLAKAPARSPEALRRQHAARTLWRAERDAYARIERAVVAADAEAFGRAVDALEQARSAHAVATRAPPRKPGADEG
jgi:membrane associated rhomboid family serine protease